ncbi:hypothetical protein HELRODRAFT_179041 [Helobdella robusta]|uniref:Uncharacterized protein n=1 Tax=Helobdella robusta TaxID=6412 RepID=T1FE32_HELRO|nr:hypothetical protein HELRODRAFT_179041 [Helobdella robusta]ESN95847.1 hypothetical protein HELRODRAFT_179041 [Helobdella robusta]
MDQHGVRHYSWFGYYYAFNKLSCNNENIDETLQENPKYGRELSQRNDEYSNKETDDETNPIIHRNYHLDTIKPPAPTFWSSSSSSSSLSSSSSFHEINNDDTDVVHIGENKSDHHKHVSDDKNSSWVRLKRSDYFHYREEDAGSGFHKEDAGSGSLKRQAVYMTDASDLTDGDTINNITDNTITTSNNINNEIDVSNSNIDNNVIIKCDAMKKVDPNTSTMQRGRNEDSEILKNKNCNIGSNDINLQDYILIKPDIKSMKKVEKLVKKSMKNKDEMGKLERKMKMFKEAEKYHENLKNVTSDATHIVKNDNLAVNTQTKINSNLAIKNFELEYQLKRELNAKIFELTTRMQQLKLKVNSCDQLLDDYCTNMLDTQVKIVELGEQMKKIVDKKVYDVVNELQCQSLQYCQQAENKKTDYIKIIKNLGKLRNKFVGLKYKKEGLILHMDSLDKFNACYNNVDFRTCDNEIANDFEVKNRRKVHFEECDVNHWKNLCLGSLKHFSVNFANRWVLRSVLIFVSNGEVVREGGREFQRKDPKKASADLAKECLRRVKKKQPVQENKTWKYMRKEAGTSN